MAARIQSETIHIATHTLFVVTSQSMDKMPLYFKTITAVKLQISTLCQICFQNKQLR